MVSKHRGRERCTEGRKQQEGMVCKFFLYSDVHGTIMLPVELLPRNAEDLGLILTSAADYMEFARSSCDRVGFPWMIWFPPSNLRRAGW